MFPNTSAKAKVAIFEIKSSSLLFCSSEVIWGGYYLYHVQLHAERFPIMLPQIQTLLMGPSFPVGPHALTNSLNCADPLTDNNYKQILFYYNSQQSDKHVYHTNTCLFSPAWFVVTVTDTLWAAPAPLAWETPLRAWMMKV